MAGDDVYRTMRDRVAGYTGAYADYVLLVPDLFLLITRLILDPRIDAKHKAYLGAAVAYVISPIDLLPESRLGPIGYLDDLVVTVAALNMVFNEVDRRIILEHWSGTEDLLGTIQKVLAQADQLIGRARLEKMLEAIGIRKKEIPA